MHVRKQFKGTEVHCGLTLIHVHVHVRMRIASLLLFRAEIIYMISVPSSTEKNCGTN